MRRRLATITSIVGLTFFGGIFSPAPSRAACCIEGCPSVPWSSCTATSQCTGGVCPGPTGSAIQFDPGGVCGEGNFSSCPPDEVGQCTDGVNNDEWTGDLLTDCDDSDCFGDPSCPTHAVPAAGGAGLAMTAAALLAVGIVVLRSRGSSALR